MQACTTGTTQRQGRSENNVFALLLPSIKTVPFHALQNQHLYRLLRHSRLSAFQTFVQQSLDGFLVKCEWRRGRRRSGTCMHVTVGLARTPCY